MSSLRDKMKNYEVTPPANAWDKIAAALDEGHQEDQFPSRLHAMEVAPPANAWNKIAASLEEPGAIVINQPSRFRQFIRYAAAAAVIGAIAFGIAQWTGSSVKSSNGVAVAKPAPDSGKSNAVSNTGSTSAADVASAGNETDQPDKLIAKLDRPYKNPSRRNNPAVQNTVYSSGLNKSRAIYTYNDHVPSIADRYIMLMTPDGNLIRMSKKWGNLVCCVSGEDPEADCKDQLKRWQEKMATSSLTTSAGNFMDILNLVNSLDEGTDL